jgi:poly-beta-1,6-N-acetyl-D-glucosamine synthase
MQPPDSRERHDNQVEPQDSPTSAAPVSRYVVVTAARNEAAFIELTLKSMVNQTLRPEKWIIVSDGSTDGTDDIVLSYTRHYRWIELIRLPEHTDRTFAAKAYAFNLGCASMSGIAYDAIVNLDADVSFDDDYFSFLLGKLAHDSRLGVVGTAFRDVSLHYDYRFVSLQHVAGPCQMFRRACLEQISGYSPSRSGGVDHIAVIAARMKGWKTRTYPEKTYVHHRPMGTATHGVLQARYRAGRLDYALGSHPLWQLFRTAYQTTKRPYLVGALMLFLGYTAAAVRRQDRPVSADFIAFRRREQMRRIRSLLTRNAGDAYGTVA